MRVHHLDCCTMCPVGGRLVNDQGRMVGHVLLIEHPDGLVLVDSGISTADVREPSRLGAPFRRVVRPVLDPDQTALHQVRALGFDPTDVRHVICTHLDLDHAGGITDFPHARVHVLEAEHRAAMRPSLHDAARYRSVQWAHGPDWALHRASGEPWHGFAAVRDLGLGPDLLMVPLIGHTHGHAAVAVRTADGWLLHCGDAYFHHCQLDGRRPPAGLRLMERLDAVDLAAVRANVARLGDLRDGHPEIRLFCAHDPVELERCRASA